MRFVAIYLWGVKNKESRNLYKRKRRDGKKTQNFNEFIELDYIIKEFFTFSSSIVSFNMHRGVKKSKMNFERRRVVFKWANNEDNHLLSVLMKLWSIFSLYKQGEDETQVLKICMNIYFSNYSQNVALKQFSNTDTYKKSFFITFNVALSMWNRSLYVPFYLFPLLFNVSRDFQVQIPRTIEIDKSPPWEKFYINHRNPSHLFPEY